MATPPNILSQSDRIEDVRNDPLYAAREDLLSKVDFFDGGEEGNRLILKRDPASEAPSSAVLRMVGQISRNKHSLRPNGTYNPAHKLRGEDVTSAKLRFYINAPKKVGVSVNEYNTFVDNLRAIQAADVDTFMTPTMYRPFTDNKDVKFLHPLVIPRENEEEDGDEDRSEYDDAGCVHDNHEENNAQESPSFASNPALPPDPFSFEGWPASPDWRNELESFKDTHDVYPMQAFAKTGQLIHPSEYVKKLVGAVVDISFTLVHYNFSKKHGGGSSRMCLYVAELHVLVPPERLPGSVTSSKGKFRRH